MVSSDVESLIYDVKMSSVVPASISGEDKVHELSSIDLAMKLHYLRGLYFFTADAAQGLDIFNFKKPMFGFLEPYYLVSGRIRKAGDGDGGGLPVIKCNDSGVRIVEAKCRKTMNEWLDLAVHENSMNDQLVFKQTLGPDLAFTPLVFMQYTWFKCGGLSVGLSWAHVLGDSFSALDFIKNWGDYLAGRLKTDLLGQPRVNDFKLRSSSPELSISIKSVDPVGDHWQIIDAYKMEKHTFYLSPHHVHRLFSKVSGSNEAKLKSFDIISAVIWKILAKLRRNSGTTCVTICRNDPSKRTNELPSNSQVISEVEADFDVSQAGLPDLAKMIAEKQVDVRGKIEEIVESDKRLDYIVYGANLTFVNLEDANVYGFEVNGKKPIFANHEISGVGDEGMIIVVPRVEDDKGECGRLVNVILPDFELARLKIDLRNEYGIY